MSTPRVAMEDDSIGARVVARTPLVYASGADAATDRPAHVRSASGIVRIAGKIIVIQDDANFIAVLDADGRNARALALPAGEGGRRQFDDLLGNKAHKLDLEACVAVDVDGEPLLLAFGSGSSARREQVVIVDGLGTARPPRVTLRDATALYSRLRGERDFAGSQLNIEGAVLIEDRIRLFSRGNGAPRDGVLPLNASCDLQWVGLRNYLLAPDAIQPPMPADIVQYDLGLLGGVPLGFTDAAVWGDPVLFTAAAEDTPDVTLDGPVSGCAVGIIHPDGRTRWAPIVDAGGALFGGKVEGLLPPRRGEDRALLVTDADDPTRASELCIVQVSGAWLS